MGTTARETQTTIKAKGREVNTMTYAITKKFISGILEGQEYKELSGVCFQEGKEYDNYICTSCRPINDNDTVQMTATRPYQQGGGEAFVSGTYSYIKTTKKQWASNDYFNFHCWVD